MIKGTFYLRLGYRSNGNMVNGNSNLKPYQVLPNLQNLSLKYKENLANYNAV